MHIPDGFLDVKTCITTGIVGAGAVAYSLRKTRVSLSRRQVPMIALTGAFIFAAQMLNFPIAGATSGHFLGGAMASILFGPAVAVVIMSAVLIIQALIFQDGGLTVLGANILCTGVIGSYAGYGVYRLGLIMLRGRLTKAVTFVAAWCSIVSAACGVALLLAWSGTFPIGVALQAMAGWHSLIGIGEGLLTALAVAYLTERNVDMEGLQPKPEVTPT
ncbi:energy-coupling factor ABC transporter permease [Cohnella silvisoli]|uniref:Energy-coupling factor ABC transporter permease n=1 Tax=Cohnella silvisoli TaxID=2873699 RepID=A0ABV1L3P6_9BACL|nr:energy-coupling factor ABC transporter permease [Cohnella silvisoli]MCD9026282.1 energy-coupling factor ABC transporter permease [Cohnella silvisoli]